MIRAYRSEPVNPEAFEQFCVARDSIASGRDLFDDLADRALQIERVETIAELGVAMCALYRIEASGRDIHGAESFGPQSAFMLCARGIEHCADRYNLSAVPPKSAEKLVQAITEQKTIQCFIDISNMYQWENKEYEAWLMLRSREKDSPGVIFHEEGYFSLDPDKFPDQNTLRTARVLEVDRAFERPGVPAPGVTYGRCPAGRFIGPIIKDMTRASIKAGLFEQYLTT